MPRFFFHLHGGQDLSDEEGVLLDDLDAVRVQALKGARDIMANEVKSGHLPLNESICVTDEQGAVVHRQRFPDAIVIVHESESE
ncbi:MAG: hypothetical protein ABR588_02600 [Sphingomicrobium sp.]|nr:hypothetical protein [Sphingomonadales bacterium]